jgi:hypothetical protein
MAASGHALTRLCIVQGMHAGASAHISAVAEALATFDADMIALVEVEDCSVLDTLVSQLDTLKGDQFTGYLIQGTDSVTGQDVALLTRCDLALTACTVGLFQLPWGPTTSYCLRLSDVAQVPCMHLAIWACVCHLALS